MTDDHMALEQWIDFLVDRRWRNSILCRADARPAPFLIPALIEERIRSCAVLSRFRPSPSGPPGEQAAPEGALRFRDHRGTEVAPGLPATTRALTLLAESWPRALRFDELAARVAESPGVPDPAVIARELTNNLLRMAFLGSISLMRAPPEIAGAIGERPAASAHARWQAARRPHALNRHHATIALDEAERGLVALLDGTRDRGALDAEWRRLTGNAGRNGAAGADEVLRGLLDRAMLID